MVNASKQSVFQNLEAVANQDGNFNIKMELPFCLVDHYHCAVYNSASSIWKDDKKLHKEFEFFKGNCKTKRAGQFSLINETLYNWYGKCCAAGISRQCY